MFSEVICWILRCTERSILGYTSTFYYVSVMVQEVAILRWLEDLSWSCVFLAYVCWGIYSPEIMKNWFIESVIYDGKTEIFDVFVELWFWYGVRSSWTVELLNHKNGLLNFFPDIVLIFSSILNVGMISEIESFLYFTKICGLFWYFYLMPKSIKKLFSVLWHFASNCENEFRETD